MKRIIEILMAVAIAVALIWLIAGCQFDPITPPRTPHNIRTNAFGTTNASFDAFRAFPVARRPLLPQKLIQDEPVRMEFASTAKRSLMVAKVVTAAGWQFNDVPGPVHEYPHLVLMSTPPRLKWQATNGFYRVLVMAGTNWHEHSFTCVWGRPWLESPWLESVSIEVPLPTNKTFKVVAP